MKKNRFAALFMALLTAAAFAGCSSSSGTASSETESSASSEAESSAASEEESSAFEEETDDGEYLYGYTEMSYADFWYGEIVADAVCDEFDLENPDLTVESEEYTHMSYSSSDDEDPYAGVQKSTWDNDSGMYDAVSRATVGYGLYRASFANVVEVKLDDGSTQVFSNEIVKDESAPTGYSITVNSTSVPGIVFGSNTRLDTDSTEGYTPDAETTYENSVAGYRITGLKKVPVRVKKATVEAAEELTEAGETNAQLEAFNAQLEKITFVDESEMTSYAYKELYANGVYGARVVNENADVLSTGAYLGDGENGTKTIAHGDGFADLTMYIYLDAYDGYTRGSIQTLDEDSLDSLYAKGETVSTYADNKEAGDKLAGFMNYALNFQGAKLQWAGEDGEFDTDDDVFVGNILHKDSYFSFNHGNYIEVSLTNAFERFSNLGNGDYRVTLISEGYEDVTVEADGLVLDYHTPTLVEEDIPALESGATELTVQLDNHDQNVSVNAKDNEGFRAYLIEPTCYSLSYEDEETGETIVLATEASSVEENDEVYTVSFNVEGQELPEDIHYQVTYTSGIVDPVTVEFHYAPAD